jgi:hypothetical protein
MRASLHGEGKAKLKLASVCSLCFLGLRVLMLRVNVGLLGLPLVDCFVFSSSMRVLGLRVFLSLLGFLLGAVFCG